LQNLLKTCKDFYRYRFLLLPSWSRCNGCFRLLKKDHYHNKYNVQIIRDDGVANIIPLDEKKLYYGSKYCAEKRNTVLAKSITPYKCNCEMKRMDIWTVKPQINHNNILQAKKFKKITSRAGDGMHSATFKKSQHNSDIQNYTVRSTRKPNKRNNSIKTLKGCSKDVLEKCANLEN